MPYHYYECPDCGYDMILSDEIDAYCALCAEDGGHAVLMYRREALESDMVEGPDARID